MSNVPRFKEGDKVRLTSVHGEPLDPDNGKIGDEGYVQAVYTGDQKSINMGFDYMIDFGGLAPDAFHDDELEAVDE